MCSRYVLPPPQLMIKGLGYFYSSLQTKTTENGGGGGR
jgi:hypothetical protein